MLVSKSGKSRRAAGAEKIDMKKTRTTGGGGPPPPPESPESSGAPVAAAEKSMTTGWGGPGPRDSMIVLVVPWGADQISELDPVGISSQLQGLLAVQCAMQSITSVPCR